MKLKHLSILVLVATMVVACGNDKKEAEPETITVESGNDVTANTTETTATSVEFKDNKDKDVFQAYLNLKDALVSTDPAMASAEASKLMTAFANVGVEDNALKAAQNIVESSDVEAQRTAFVAVTTAVEALMEDAVANGTIYKQYCPMAFNNTGAAWLSDSNEIYNPYFGSKMLKCGRIDAKIE